MPTLSDTQIRNFKPKAKQYKKFDTGGLYILVRPSGAKVWCMKFTFNKKPNLLGFGPYPEITLADARKKRDAARNDIANGRDPAIESKNRRAGIDEALANTLNVFADKYLNINKKWSNDHYKRVSRTLEKDVRPFLGKSPVSSIKPQDVLKVLEKVQARGAKEASRRIIGYMRKIYAIAINEGYAQHDPTLNLHKSLEKHTVKHRATITDPKEIGALIAASKNYWGTPSVKAALQLSPLLYLRPTDVGARLKLTICAH